MSALGWAVASAGAVLSSLLAKQARATSGDPWAELERSAQPAQRDAWAERVIRGGELDPVIWHPVTMRGGLTVYVTGDQLSWKGIRVRASNRIAQLAADELGALLPTAAIVRATHQAAERQIDALPEAPNPGASVAGWRRHEERIASALARYGSPGRPHARLTSSTGKDYVLRAGAVRPDLLLFYGWRSAQMGQTPWNVDFPEPMIQDPQGGGGVGAAIDGGHAIGYFDYSHGIRLVRRTAELDGQPIDLADVYRSTPELVSHLPGDKRPIPLRHPQAIS